MTDNEPLGLGIIGAGRFGRFVAAAAAALPEVSVVAVTDTDTNRAGCLAEAHRAAALPDPAALLRDERVHAVVIATPPRAHATLSLQALAAQRHVFCEKPVALTCADADAVRAAVAASRRAYVVDHVLRYNPVLAALRQLQDAGLLGAVRRFAFENDAADEDLPTGHWFWDHTISGGILLEHGVHFFDAAAMLIGAPAQRVQAIGSTRLDGRADTVVCTVAHAGGALATYAHGFSHPHRAERQLMRLDYGLAEARIHGWIPLRADLDIWTDDVQAFHRLTDDMDLLTVPGVPPLRPDQVAVSAEEDSTSATACTRDGSHHLRVRMELGGAETKQAVYRDSVRAALLDLAVCARSGATPRADIDAGRAAVQVAAAGSHALHDGHTHHLPARETS